MKNRKKQTGADDWLVTYGDLITLLLVFFVLLYAISSVNVSKFKSVANLLSKTFGGETIVASKSGGGESVVDFGLMLRELNNKIKVGNLENAISVKKQGNNIVIRGKGDIFFPSGSATLTPRIKRFLSSIAPVLKTSRNEIEVIGHTDDIPIKSPKYPSNWELSSARACSVIRYFTDVEHMSPYRFKASGYAEFKPFYPPIPANRAKNRRIEIVIKGNKDGTT